MPVKLPLFIQKKRRVVRSARHLFEQDHQEDRIGLPPKRLCSDAKRGAAKLSRFMYTYVSTSRISYIGSKRGLLQWVNAYDLRGLF